MSLLSQTDYQAIGLSIRVAVVATLISLPVGFFAAYAMTFLQFRGKRVLEVLINLPLTLPPVVIGYFLLLALGNKGWLGPFLNWAGFHILFTWKAAVIASAVVGFPLLVRSIRIGLEGVDVRKIQAARVLGATWSDALLHITLPLAMRGIVAGSSLMFARSMGEFGATILVAGNIPGVTQTIPLAIYDYAASPNGDRTALLLCLVAVAISVLVLSLHESLAKRLSRRD
jgi:molybdate transport system permease protein